MNRRLRVWLWIVAIVGVALISITLSRDTLMKAVVVHLVRAQTGLGVSVERVETRILHPSLRITGAVIRNPPGYPAGEALRIEELYIELDRSKWGGETNQFKEIRLDIPRLVMVFNEEGDNNFSAIGAQISRQQAALNEKKQPSAPSAESVSPPGPLPDTEAVPPGASPPVFGGEPAPTAESKPVFIENVTLKIGVLEVQQWDGAEGAAATESLPIDFQYTLHHVSDLDAAGKEIGLALLVQAAPALMKIAQKQASMTPPPNPPKKQKTPELH